MMKFVLGLIVAILVALGIYTYSNQSTEKNNPTPSISEKKIEVKETEKVSVVAQEVQKKKSSVKAKKVIDRVSVTKESTGQEETIGEGLTLEGIENADVSDEEKERMRDDIAYNHLKNIELQPVLAEKEITQMMIEDLKEGF